MPALQKTNLIKVIRRIGLILICVSASIFIGVPLITYIGYHPYNPVRFFIISGVLYVFLGLIGIVLHSEANKCLRENKFW